MMGLRTPVISVVIGEGGSGGALALAAADRVICWKTPFTPSFRRRAAPASSGRTPAAWRMRAQCLHITAADMVDLHVAEEIIPENFADFPQMCAAMTVQLTMDLDELCALSPEGCSSSATAATAASACMRKTAASSASRNIEIFRTISEYHKYHVIFES